MKPTFNITFNDNSCFLGESFNSDWLKVPELPIQRLIFSFGGLRLTLNGYEEYNHLIENIALMGKRNIVSKILIIGRKHNDAYIFEFDLRNKKFQKNVLPIGQEYNNMILKGWKKGISTEPKYLIEKIRNVT